MELTDEVLAFLKTNRFYVFFADGTWRTCSDGQWKEEQIWKLEPVVTGWFQITDFDLKVIQAVVERKVSK